MSLKRLKYECPVCRGRVSYVKRKGLMDLNVRQVECEGCGKMCTVFTFDLDDKEKMKRIGGVKGMVGLLRCEGRIWEGVFVDKRVYVSDEKIRELAERCEGTLKRLSE